MEFACAEEMNKNDQAWVTAAIDNAICLLKPRGWKKALHVLKDIAPLGGILTVVLGLLAIIITLIIGVTNRRNRREADAKFQGQTDGKFTAVNTRLDTLERDVREIGGRLAARDLREHATLAKQEFQKSLPEVKSALTAASHERVRVSADIIADLQQKLLQTKTDNPVFWSTAGIFISYRSFNLSPQQVTLLDSQISNCTDSDPTPMRIGDVSPDKSTFTLVNSYYDNCRLTLDSAHDGDRINKILTTQSTVIEFRRCLIDYHGGQVNLIMEWKDYPATIQVIGKPESVLPVKFSGKALWFDSCLFEFSIEAPPPPIGQKLTQTLLGSEYQHR
jgi:hypothetical protein